MGIDWVAGTVCHMGGRVDFTLAPMSGTGTGFDPLPSRERGFSRLFCLVVAQPFTSGLRIKSAMT